MSKNNFLTKNIQILKLVFKICKPLIFYVVIYLIANISINILELYLISYITKGLVNNIDKTMLLTNVLYITIITIVLMFFQTFYKDYLENKYRYIYVKNVQKQLFLKALEIDLKEFDNPLFYDKFSRTMRDSQRRGFLVFRTIIDFINAVAISIAVGGYIIITDYFVLLICIISVLIATMAISKINKLQYQLFKDTEVDSRYYFYVNRIFYQQRFASEIKTTNLNNILIDKYYEKTDIIDKKYMKNDFKILKYNILNYLGSDIVGSMGAYVYITYRLFNGLLQLSSFSTMLASITKFTSNILDAAMILVNLQMHALYIDDYLEIMNYTSSSKKGSLSKLDQFNSLELKNIVFGYDRNLVLDHISLKLNKGDHIALVGTNGAGKTTLVKLILRLYDLTEGDIYYNGINYQSIDQKAIHEKISVIYQDFQIYSVTVAENILMHKVESKEDEIRVLNALEKVGLKDKVLRTKLGINTIISKEFDRKGLMLSGGEAQKLCLARIFASNADIYILDEPTASLDPLAEEQINRLLMNTCKDKTIIIIAHRLSSVVDTNCIYLIKNGKISEQGTHKELLALNRDYAKMFYTQKNLYEKNEE